jgi:hypothetical protein
MSAERRSSPRQRVLRRASIYFGNGRSSVRCVVLDLTGAGARLRVHEWLGVPERFDLRIDNGPSQIAEVCYRDMDVAGVRFLDQTAY